MRFQMVGESLLSSLAGHYPDVFLVPAFPDKEASLWDYMGR